MAVSSSNSWTQLGLGNQTWLISALTTNHFGIYTNRKYFKLGLASNVSTLSVLLPDLPSYPLHENIKHIKDIKKIVSGI